MNETPLHTLADLADQAERQPYVLRLYVTGMTPRSTRAISAVRAICEEFLAGRFDLKIIDVYQQPALIRDEQIFATPTLVRKGPEPERRMIGDMSNRARLLAGLGLLEVTPA
ncbi:MAG TPA: circadian clock KaiB family protein [Steroidobacteraceae bacterium]|nr:circadian clock KaiB family protein [Steroidobacteraceae bacterium]